MTTPAAPTALIVRMADRLHPWPAERRQAAIEAAAKRLKGKHPRHKDAALVAAFKAA